MRSTINRCYINIVTGRMLLGFGMEDEAATIMLLYCSHKLRELDEKL